MPSLKLKSTYLMLNLMNIYTYRFVAYRRGTIISILQNFNEIKLKYFILESSKIIRAISLKFHRQSGRKSNALHFISKSRIEDLSIVIELL